MLYRLSARALPLFTTLFVAACGGGGEATEGPPGPAGPKGEPGPAGPTGETGPAGPAGVAGSMGPAGPIGPAGPAGAQGVAGMVGATGAMGPAGPAGAAGMIGPQGMIGPAGPAGAAGPVGAAGPAGPAGPAGTFSGNFVGDATFTGNVTISGAVNRALGTDAANPATSCAALLAARPGIASGVYWLRPASARSSFVAYCDMVNDGGGWTLVWSNLRGGRGKPTTELQWKVAITTPPRTDGRAVSDDLEGFVVYTGLSHWTPLAPAGLLRYDWAPDYQANIEQRYRCPFTFGVNYTLNLTTAACVQPLGNVVPGLRTEHNGRPFTTYDRDLDGFANNCAGQYSDSPWWYSSCWNGSIAGGGEYSAGHYNGAYWTGAVAQWGTAGGIGAGNGWMYVR